VFYFFSVLFFEKSFEVFFKMVLVVGAKSENPLG
jgi:hypothetical protein